MHEACAAAAADDELVRDEVALGRPVVPVDPAQQRRQRDVADRVARLSHGREVELPRRRKGDVVESDDRNVFRHPQAALEERIDGADRDQVVPAEDRLRP